MAATPTCASVPETATRQRDAIDALAARSTWSSTQARTCAELLQRIDRLLPSKGGGGDAVNADAVQRPVYQRPASYRPIAFGSAANAFGARTSDVDVVLVPRDESVTHAAVGVLCAMSRSKLKQLDKEFMRAVEALLGGHDEDFTGVHLVFGAVFVAKFRDASSGVACDVTRWLPVQGDVPRTCCAAAECRVPVARNTALFRRYASQGRRGKCAVVLFAAVRAWAAHAAVTGNHEGYPSTYAFLVLLLAHLTQRGGDCLVPSRGAFLDRIDPHALCVLRESDCDGTCIEDAATTPAPDALPRLLASFFAHYAGVGDDAFSPARDVVCLRCDAEPPSRASFFAPPPEEFVDPASGEIRAALPPALAPDAPSWRMVIQDPILPAVDLGRKIASREHQNKLLAAMRRAAEELLAGHTPAWLGTAGE